MSYKNLFFKIYNKAKSFIIYLIFFSIVITLLLSIKLKNKEIEKLSIEISDISEKYFKTKYASSVKSYYVEKITHLNSEDLFKIEFELNTQDELLIHNEPYTKIIDEDLKLNNYKTKFISGIKLRFPGSAFIDIADKRIFVISSAGVLGSGLINENLKIKPLQSNINSFYDKSYFKKRKEFSIKDLLIFNDKIFVSFIRENKKNCFNISVIAADLNFEFLEFEEYFNPNECLISNLDQNESELIDYFTPNQSGGRIIGLNNDNLILTIGDFRFRYLAQNKDSVFGKILKINSNNNQNYEILSMGHRNPQGLIKLKNENILMSTEHGPKGGDEINLIDLNDKKIINYGWPVSSYGNHYGPDDLLKKRKYEVYPLHKNHKDFGFKEPIKFYDESYGISEIQQIKNNLFVHGSMKRQELVFFELNEDRNSINVLFSIKINERIRDMKYYDKKLYMFLENSASISIFDLTSIKNLDL